MRYENLLFYVIAIYLIINNLYINYSRLWRKSIILISKLKLPLINIIIIIIIENRKLNIKNEMILKYFSIC